MNELPTLTTIILEEEPYYYLDEVRFILKADQFDEIQDFMVDTHTKQPMIEGRVLIRAAIVQSFLGSFEKKVIH